MTATNVDPTTVGDRSDTIEHLAKALALAQGEIRAAEKDRANDFFKSSYATLSSVWEACRAPLTKNSLSIVQQPINDGTRVGVITTLLHGSGQWMRSALFVTPKDGTPQSLGSAITYVRRYALAAVAGVAPDDDDGNAAQRGSEGQGPKADKAPPAARANTVKATGQKASAEQVKLLHVLKSKAGVTECPGNCAKDVKEWSKKANGLVDNTVRCVYHTQLAAFKDADGNPVTTSKDLSPEQMSNLIDRYQKKIDGQVRRGDETPDLGSLGGRAKAPPEAALAIAGALKTRDMDAQELCSIFGVDDVTEIAAEDADKALALVFAWGTGNYGRILADVTGVPQ